MKKSLLVLSLLAAAPLAAHAAEGLNYTYAQAGYSHLDGKDDRKANGFNAEASFALAPNWHLFGGTQQLKQGDFHIGTQAWKLGAGYNREIAPSTDFVARAAYQRMTTDDLYVGGSKITSGAHLDGFGVEVGVRAAFTPRFEGYAMAGYEKYGRHGSYQGPKSSYGRLGAQLSVHPNWGVVGDLKFSGDDYIWTVGPRFSW